MNTTHIESILLHAWSLKTRQMPPSKVQCSVIVTHDLSSGGGGVVKTAASDGGHFYLIKGARHDFTVSKFGESLMILALAINAAFSHSIMRVILLTESRSDFTCTKKG